jgi:hypothetical protein
MSLESLYLEGYFEPVFKGHKIVLHTQDATFPDHKRTAPLKLHYKEIDVTDKVVELFRRILELTPEADHDKVRQNAREHFHIEIG